MTQAGDIIEIIDVLNKSSYFENDAMNHLVKVTLYRKDVRRNVNEAQIMLCQIESLYMSLSHRIPSRCGFGRGVKYRRNTMTRNYGRSIYNKRAGSIDETE